jgi:protein-tyrosine-phosphatase
MRAFKKANRRTQRLAAHRSQRFTRLARATLNQITESTQPNFNPSRSTGFSIRKFDYVITVCDRAAESCPMFSGDPKRIDWSFEHPAAVKDEEERRRAFKNVATGLAGRRRIWLSLSDVSRRLEERFPK